jgi:hypothetical protein
MMCLFCDYKAILVYEDLSNPYGIAGTLLHVQVSQSYLSKPVSILLSFPLFQAAFLEPIPYVKNDLSWVLLCLLV